MSRWGDDEPVVRGWAADFALALSKTDFDALAKKSLHDSVLASLNAHVDELAQCIDRLVCEDVDLERIERYTVSPSDDMENGLLVDGKKVYTSTTVYEVRGDEHFFVSRGLWVGAYAHLNPAADAS